MPVGKQPRLPTCHLNEPMCGASMVPAEPLVFPHGPTNQKVVEMTEDWVQLGLVEAPVVQNPAAQDRIPHARQVINGLVAPHGQSPAPHLLAHLGHRLRAHRRREVDEELAPSILRPPRAKRVAQEIKPFLGIPAWSVIILAVDDARLRRMHFQPTLSKTTSDALQNLLRLRLCPAVRDNIICVSLEGYARMDPAHPVVECEMQKDIGQQRTDHSALRGPLRPPHQRSILQSGGSFEPPLEVEENPLALRVLSNRPKHQLVVEIIEEAADVEVNDPGIPPASLPRTGDSIERRLLRPIAIGVWMEGRFHPWLQVDFDHRLSNPVGYRGNAQSPLASVFLRYPDRANWRRKVRTRRHAIPNLIEIVLQVFLEHLNRFSINSSRSLIRFDPLIRLPHDPLGNTERLGLTHRFLPLARLTGASNRMTRSLRSLGLFPSSSLLRIAPSLCLASIRWSSGVLPWASLFTSRRQVPTFRTKAWIRVTPPLCRMPSRQAADSPWAVPGSTTRPGFDIVPTLSTRSRWFTSVRLSDPYLTRSCRAVSLDAHHPDSLPEQLKVVWSLPCRPAPRGHPSSLVQLGHFELTAPLHHGLLSAPSWRTIVGEPGVLDFHPRPLASDCFRPLQHPVHLIEVEITEQGRNHLTLRNTLLPRRPQQQLEQPQHLGIAHPPSHFFQYEVMLYRVQVGSEVKIDDVGQTPQDRFRDALNRSVR